MQLKLLAKTKTHQQHLVSITFINPMLVGFLRFFLPNEGFNQIADYKGTASKNLRMAFAQKIRLIHASLLLIITARFESQ